MKIYRNKEDFTGRHFTFRLSPFTLVMVIVFTFHLSPFTLKAQQPWNYVSLEEAHLDDAYFISPSAPLQVQIQREITQTIKQSNNFQFALPSLPRMPSWRHPPSFPVRQPRFLPPLVAGYRAFPLPRLQPLLAAALPDPPAVGVRYDG